MIAAGAAAACFLTSVSAQTPAYATDSVVMPGANGTSGADLGLAFFATADANADGVLTGAELRTSLETFLADADTAKTGMADEAQLASGMKFQQPRVPQENHMQLMMSALPDKAAASPARPRKVLVFNNCAGFIHTPIPLTAKMIEAFGSKTKAWTTTISWDPADINEQNLKQFDVVVLNSTTGAFLDDPADAAMTASRRKALVDFVRSGKGLVGIHGAGDSYHQSSVPPAPGRAGGSANRYAATSATIARSIISQADKNGDRKADKAEIDAIADAWYAKLGGGRAGIKQTEFLGGIDAAMTPRAPAASAPPKAPAPMAGMNMGGEGGRGVQTGRDTQIGTWPDFNRMLGGFFKFHWANTLIATKVDDAASPLTAMFKGAPLQFRGEIYTFSMDTWSRSNLRVLTSIDYAKMDAADRAKENFPRADHDYGLTWVRREGAGRVFYFAFGNEERVFFVKPLNEQLLAGIQYALGDLKVDDAPGVK